MAFKLVNEVQIMDIKDELQQKVKERVDKHQKEYILREQLKLIREELGMILHCPMRKNLKKQQRI